MIINTGARTDTVQYFTPWLLNRLREGFALSRNPLFPNKVTRYDLSPDKVDCLVFCSKNYRPILPYLRWITGKYNTYFFYTITAYDKDIEPGVPSIDESIKTLIELSGIVGKKRVAWRYDPVLLTADYTIERHEATFSYMAKRLSPYIDRCIFSFVEMYKKLEVNLRELIPLTEEDIASLAGILGRISRENGIRIQICGTDSDFSMYGILPSGCIREDIIENANGIELRRIGRHGMRNGCHCIESRDIGAYDSCLNGCKYCYANKSPEKAIENYRLHDPESPMLLGNLRDGDTVTEARQVSYILQREAELDFGD